MSVRDNIIKDKYRNNLPYATHKAFPKEAEEYRKEDARIYAQFKADLFAQDGVSGPKAEKCFELAWDRGHAGGYMEVLNEWNDLVELIK
jgi:hypothetical protein